MNTDIILDEEKNKKDQLIKEVEDAQILFGNKITELRQLVQLQSANGNWNESPYMHGMANAFIISLAIFENEEPIFLDPPKDGYLNEQNRKKESPFASKVMDIGDLK